jgi:2',3'-cyclic-nucleotide 2'-phosphodiesterase
VVNLGSKTAVMPKALPLYGSFMAADPEGNVIVDLHGDSAWEKMEFATAVDGRAAAVLGTHTHEPTLNLHVLPGGTALVADVGMTGPTGGPGGLPVAHRGRDEGRRPRGATALRAFHGSDYARRGAAAGRGRKDLAH